MSTRPLRDGRSVLSDRQPPLRFCDLGLPFMQLISKCAVIPLPRRILQKRNR